MSTKLPILTGQVMGTLFGGNYHLTRNAVEDLPNWFESAKQLGITGVRYPGGTVTEELFDIHNPRATEATNPYTGALVSIAPLDRFIEAATKNDLSVSIVVPTRHYIVAGNDNNASREVSVDGKGLRTFITDVKLGVYGSAKISAFEIGNEYWGIGSFANGSLTTSEYASIASLMSRHIDAGQRIAAFGRPDQDSKILVQMGMNQNVAKLSDEYTSFENSADALQQLSASFDLNFDNNFLDGRGSIDWPEIANGIIIAELAKSGALNHIDGIIAHVYSRGANVDGSRYHVLNTIEETWGRMVGGKEIWVTEWNQKLNTGHLDRSTDYGLKNAHELLNIIEAMATSRVSNAFIWAVQHNTVSSLVDMRGSTKVVGAFFDMLAETLPGTFIVDTDRFVSRESEVRTASGDIHIFADSQRLVLYFASTSDKHTSIEYDLSNFITSSAHSSKRTLRVLDGQEPGNSAAQWTIDLDLSTDITAGIISVELAPYAISEIVIFDPEYTAGFADVVERAEIVSLFTANEASQDEQLREFLRDPEFGVGAGYGFEHDGVLWLTQGDDIARMSPGVNIAFLGDGADRLIGTDSDDMIFGGDSEADKSDTIYGGEGNDSIDGGWGNDLLYGDRGNDLILGGFGSDTLVGGGGNDILLGGPGSDLLVGGNGNDFLNGGFGFDRLTGGTGADTFFHLGITDHGTDWISDYSYDEGDVIMIANVTRSNLLVSSGFTSGAGEDDIAEVFIRNSVTGHIYFAIVDGSKNDSLLVQVEGVIEAWPLF